MFLLIFICIVQEVISIVSFKFYGEHSSQPHSWFDKLLQILGGFFPYVQLVLLVKPRVDSSSVLQYPTMYSSPLFCLQLITTFILLQFIMLILLDITIMKESIFWSVCLTFHQCNTQQMDLYSWNRIHSHRLTTSSLEMYPNLLSLMWFNWRQLISLTLSGFSWDRDSES